MATTGSRAEATTSRTGTPGTTRCSAGARSDTADFFYGDKIFGGAMVAGAGVVADLAAGTATGDDLVGTARLAPS
jgi:hypothetical protein